MDIMAGTGAAILDHEVILGLKQYRKATRQKDTIAPRAHEAAMPALGHLSLDVSMKRSSLVFCLSHLPY